MRCTLPFALLALLLSGCAAPSDAVDNGFARVDSDSDEDDDDTGIGSGGNGEGPADDDDLPIGDDDDDSEDPVDDGWDTSSPEPQEGSLITFEIECGLLMGMSLKTWEYQIDRWVEVRIDGQESRPRPEFDPCFADGGKWLRWYEDGEIYFEAGGMAHDLRPTEVEERWMGEVTPLSQSSTACNEALELGGLGWPVTMSFQLVSFQY
ncbi:MAG: hypothetical protein KDA24_17080 [Deltaproteobacteria bacterium]|nr:hypothetical protein [Deltaproteobacteria bacterium]